jgi:hypothetical protein
VLGIMVELLFFLKWIFKKYKDLGAQSKVDKHSVVEQCVVLFFTSSFTCSQDERKTWRP